MACFVLGENNVGEVLVDAHYKGKKMTLNSAQTKASFKKKQKKMIITVGCEIIKVHR